MKQIDIPRERLIVASMRLKSGETYKVIAESMGVGVFCLQNNLKRAELFECRKGANKGKKYTARVQKREDEVRQSGRPVSQEWDEARSSRYLSMPLRVRV